MITIGLMSGTSLDGLDGVLVQWGDEADTPNATAAGRVLSRCSQAFDERLRAELLALNQSGADELHRAALAANRLSIEAASVVAQLLRSSGVAPTAVQAIGFHGQTVRHRPGAFDGIGYTLQLHNASLLAELSGIDVVCDFRSRDVSAGGQGAPLVPAFHAGVFRERGCDVAVLNLGGIANLTLLHADGRIRGFDCGPANVLLDGWCARHTGAALDEDGRWSASGRVHEPLLQRLCAEPFFARPAPKSTGRDLFNLDWLERMLDGLGEAERGTLHPVDVQATLAELSAWCVDEHLKQHLPQAAVLKVCGGGALNADVMGRLQRRLQQRHPQGRVDTTAAAGWPVLDVEAGAFAWLACQFLRREPGNVVPVTGARGPRVLGALYPAGR